MRWSQAFIPTLRDDPNDADAASHRLLLRAGFIRQLMAGHYTYLPLAQRVRLKIIEILRQEMNGIGAQEVVMPAMNPIEVWQQSGRDKSMAEILYSFERPDGQKVVLGPTAEEVVTPLAVSEIQSYKNLPQIWYQMTTKFRYEARPKSGLLRVREFTMKDSYSFDLDDASLDNSFEAHRGAYTRFFTRIGLDPIPVQASSGAMGGSASIEFMAQTNAGEDDIVRCTSCDYAANVEKATSTIASVDDGEKGASTERFDTPGVRTIKDLETFAGGVNADRQIKTLVYIVDGQVTLVLLRGDHDLVEQKLIDATAATAVRPATPEEIKSALGAMPGSLGAVGVSGLPVLADEALRGRYNMTTGANTDDVHVRNVDVERDITVEKWASFRLVKAGEACPNDGGTLDVVHTVEIGHIFKLGDRYTREGDFDMTVLGPDGSKVRPVMGCYGIGVERALASVVEQNHDDKGIVWPVAIAPFHVAVVPLNADNDEVMGAAKVLYDELNGGGIDTILDDRDARAGVKLSDVELVGIPVRVTIGKRGIANRVVEVTVRRTGETTEVPLLDAAEYIDKLLASLSQ
jgi:prolyl-tRNA synthetase family II